MRAQLPKVFPLTPAEIRALGAGGIHSVTMREEDGFSPRLEVHPLPGKVRFAVAAVTVQRIETGIYLSYRYTGTTGAPDRSHRPPVELHIVTGRRARIACNGRFSGYSVEWLYKLSVITVAVGFAPGADLFTAAPDHNVEDLAELF